MFPLILFLDTQALKSRAISARHPGILARENDSRKMQNVHRPPKESNPNRHIKERGCNRILVTILHLSMLQTWHEMDVNNKYGLGNNYEPYNQVYVIPQEPCDSTLNFFL